MTKERISGMAGEDGVVNNIINYFDFKSHWIKEQILRVNGM